MWAFVCMTIHPVGCWIEKYDKKILEIKIEEALRKISDIRNIIFKNEEKLKENGKELIKEIENIIDEVEMKNDEEIRAYDGKDNLKNSYIEDEINKISSQSK